jgi:hypothetical protein
MTWADLMDDEDQLNLIVKSVSNMKKKWQKKIVEFILVGVRSSPIDSAL